MRLLVLSPRGRRLGFSLVACCALLGATPAAQAPERRAAEAEDGYDLWLRYRPIADATRLAEYRSAFANIVVETSSPTLDAARAELERGLSGLLARSVTTSSSVAGNGVLVLGTPASSKIIASLKLGALKQAGDEGFLIRSTTIRGKRATVIAANHDIGVLYGAFHLLRRLQTLRPASNLAIVSAPKIKLRMLDHWDNLDRSVERGYAGKSLGRIFPTRSPIATAITRAPTRRSESTARRSPT
jgi:alpha-glucuronidase